MKALKLIILSLLLSACADMQIAANNSAPFRTGGPDILSIDHFVPVISTVPSMTGSVAQLYVRERVRENVQRSNNLENQVVLFIHGAGTPAEVGFDTPYEGYSWMAYLATQGMDVFSMDTTGYGRSTRPIVMNDKCNLSPQQQEQLFGEVCTGSYPYAATTMASDWHDIDAVVDYLRDLRGVETVHLIGWSQGGPRSAGYAAGHTEKVGNIVLLAPAYSRNAAATAAEANIPGNAMTKQSHNDFVTNWDRQVGCENQYDPAVSDAVWGAMLESDPIGAGWGTGVRRAPRAATFGWTTEVVANTQIPILMVAGTHDAQLLPQRVKNMYEDLGSSQKVYFEMTCSSHNAMWERDAEILFDASYQWLSSTSYNGVSNGMLVQED